MNQWLLILVLLTGGASGFTSPIRGLVTVGRSRVSFSSSPPRRSSPRLSMVIEVLSDDCVSAVMASHAIGNEIGLTVLRNEVLFAGIVQQPEGAAKTLQKYKLQPDAVKAAAIQQLRNARVDLVTPNSNKDPLPFSSACKQLLEQSLVIAERLDSSSVRSEHVLLALMGYNDGKPIEAAPALDVLQGMKELRGLDGKAFSCFKFCQQLVQDLGSSDGSIRKKDTKETSNINEKEEVVIGGLGGLGTATLSSVGVDLTQMALDGQLDAVYGRNEEIRTCLRTLGRRRKNNPCLIGEPGVGKTAVAEAIAQVLASAIAEQEKNNSFKIRNPFRSKKNDVPVEYSLPPCPKALAGARLIRVELASLVAGTRNRGDFEQKVQNLIQEASKSNVVLFIDEIHNLIGTGGGGDGAMNAANLLKPALARGDLKLLGATTTPEYRKYIEKDAALERRFQPVLVKEPTVQETVEILATIMPRYEEFHGVEYTNNALLAAARLSDRYIGDRFLPDKAIDLLDEAASMVKMEDHDENYYVTEDSVTEVIASITGIPLGRLDTGEKARLRNLDQDIQKRIKGQDEAVKAVAKAVRRSRSGMGDAKRPVASFLFCGPTGVGKTELCKALAETYFGQEKDMIRLDMSEYMDRFSVSRLVGAPPGYVGFEEGGQLTEAARRSPHSVILFDELEKAHPDVLNILLQVMDDGVLTDGKGRTVNFKNTILVMTSNIGSQNILAMSRMSDGQISNSEVADMVKQELEQTMKPELLNRIDEIIVFNPLKYEDLKEIARNIIADISRRASEDRNIRLTVTENVAEMVTRQGYVASFGARPIKRAAKRYLEDTMAEAIMQEFIQEGDQVTVDLADQDSVSITRMSANGAGVKSMRVAVEGDAGIGSSSGQRWERLYGPAPSLDDDEGLPKETTGFR